MNRAIRQFVRKRAGDSCEYCRLPRWAFAPYIKFQIDHIIARKHRGHSNRANLAYSCYHCNSFKGPNVAGVDPKTGRITPLFNPRRQKWSRHFAVRGALVVGRTAVGRATVAVLNMNDLVVVDHRQTLIDLGLFGDILF